MPVKFLRSHWTTILASILCLAGVLVYESGPKKLLDLIPLAIDFALLGSLFEAGTTSRQFGNNPGADEADPPDAKTEEYRHRHSLDLMKDGWAAAQTPPDMGHEPIEIMRMEWDWPRTVYNGWWALDRQMDAQGLYWRYVKR